MARTFYDVLGVSEDASHEAITDAYRDRVKECHPDVDDDPDAGERFKRVVHAEEVLGDPDERATYDRLGHETYVKRVESQNVSGAESSPWTTEDRRETSHETTAGGSSARDPKGDGSKREGGGFDPWGKSAGRENSGRGSRWDDGVDWDTASSSMGFGPAADRQQTAGGGAGASGGYSVRGTDDLGPRDIWDVPDTLTLKLVVILASAVVVSMAVVLFLVFLLVVLL